MMNKDIAVAFSNGEFELTINSIADDAIWDVIEENKFVGKEAIIEQCNQVGAYFKSVSTDFKTLNVIQDKNHVVVNGTAEFIRNNQRVSFIFACDVYEFNDHGKIQNITSYCIQSK